ncbi:ABC transporter permease [Streptomyces sp. NRRL S-31]|uniref:ABC transporter permease n=1 Tax=Streptomyces sp. NRRL S-31 TaxID=1463898 RepID=UPI0004CBF152|nr:ABC transporter permease [Streptomyces sp. NRRL S-31]
MNALLRAGRESAHLARRNLLHLRRTPTALMGSLVEPVMFALLIGYVFGNSLGGAVYREYMVAGLLAQTVTFSTAVTALGLAKDLHEGTVDRFRALPISRVALLLGRTLSDLTTCAAGVLVTSLCGLALGWRPHSGLPHIAAGYALLFCFAFAMSWVGAFVGVVAPNVQVAASLGLIWMFPASFVSSGYVSSASLPGPLATVAAWSPITALSNALREQFATPVPPGFSRPRGWPVDHPTPYLLLWSAGLIAVFTTLATARYRGRTRA